MSCPILLNLNGNKEHDTNDSPVGTETQDSSMQTHQREQKKKLTY
jgi:hypothetical protein